MYTLAVYFITILFWVLGFFITMFLGIMIILLSFIDWSGRASQWCAHAWGRLLVWISITRVNMQNVSLLSQVQEPVIYMSSHSGFFDIYLFLGYILRQYRIVSKEEIFKLPVVGFAMRRMGYISVSRKNPKKSAKGLSQSVQTIKRGLSVLIYPEGSRSRTGEIQPFRRGSFRFAKEVNVPIVVVRITGPHQVMPPFQKGISLVYPGKKVNIEFLDIVPVKMVEDLSEQDLMLLVHDIMSGKNKKTYSQNSAS